MFIPGHGADLDSCHSVLRIPESSRPGRGACTLRVYTESDCYWLRQEEMPQSPSSSTPPPGITSVAGINFRPARRRLSRGLEPRWRNTRESRGELLPSPLSLTYLPRPRWSESEVQTELRAARRRELGSCG